MLIRNDFAKSCRTHLGFLKFCAVQLHGAGIRNQILLIQKK